MTREAAITELKKGRPQQWDWHRNIKAFDEALDMAIEALKLIPDNATNGDVIKALFKIDYIINDYLEVGLAIPVGRQLQKIMGIDRSWWDAPYRKEK